MRYRAFGVGTNSLPHAGQRTRSLSSLTKSIGAMECPHSVQTVCNDSRILLTSVLERRGMSQLMPRRTATFPPHEQRISEKLEAMALVK